MVDSKETMVNFYLGQDHNGYFDQGDVVGDICYNSINKNGQSADSSWNEKIITLGFREVKRNPSCSGCCLWDKNSKGFVGLS